MKLVRTTVALTLVSLLAVSCSSDDSAGETDEPDASGEADTRTVDDGSASDTGDEDGSTADTSSENDTNVTMDTGSTGSDTSSDDGDTRSEQDAAMDTASDTADADAAVASMTVTSSAFGDGETIPEVYTCEGDDISPPLSWSGAPSSTESFVILAADPDAPGGTFKHWAVYDIPASTTSLSEDVPNMESVMGFMQGQNQFGNIGYGAPCPPPPDDPHRYQFRVWALDVASLQFGSTPTYDQVKNAAAPNVVGKGMLTGTYGR